MTENVIVVEDLKKLFPVTKGIVDALRSAFSKEKEFVHAVDGINFSIRKGETLSIVGETGSGKTTTARLVLRLIDPTEGKIFFNGEELTAMKRREVRNVRKKMQMVFQDPFASLNPRMTVEDVVGMPLKVHKIASGRERRRMVIELLERVGLHPGNMFVDRYPHEFSGGQRQRIGVARAIASRPEFLITDEPVSSLDISIRTQILNLLDDLKTDLGLTILMISHDLSVVRYLSDSIIVMYFGKIMEVGDSEEFFENPIHPYSQALLASVPIPDPKVKRKRITLRGTPPSPIHLPVGCRFHPRCPNYDPKIGCDTIEPPIFDVEGRRVRCHLFG